MEDIEDDFAGDAEPPEEEKLPNGLVSKRPRNPAKGFSKYKAAMWRELRNALSCRGWPPSSLFAGFALCKWHAVSMDHAELIGT